MLRAICGQLLVSVRQLYRTRTEWKMVSPLNACDYWPTAGDTTLAGTSLFSEATVVATERIYS